MSYYEPYSEFEPIQGYEGEFYCTEYGMACEKCGEELDMSEWIDDYREQGHHNCIECSECGEVNSCICEEINSNFQRRHND